MVTTNSPLVTTNSILVTSKLGILVTTSVQLWPALAPEEKNHPTSRFAAQDSPQAELRPSWLATSRIAALNGLNEFIEFIEFRT